MTDIAKRLRELVAVAKTDPSRIGQTLDIFAELHLEAADEIERLRAELNEYKARASDDYYGKRLT